MLNRGQIAETPSPNPLARHCLLPYPFLLGLGRAGCRPFRREDKRYRLHLFTAPVHLADEDNVAHIPSSNSRSASSPPSTRRPLSRSRNPSPSKQSRLRVSPPSPNSPEGTASPASPPGQSGCLSPEQASGRVPYRGQLSPVAESPKTYNFDDVEVALNLCLQCPCLPFYLSPIYPPAFVSVLSTFPLTFLPSFLPTFLPTWLPSYLPTLLPTLPTLPTYLSIFLPFYLSSYMHAYLSAYMHIQHSLLRIITSAIIST